MNSLPNNDTVLDAVTSGKLAEAESLLSDRQMNGNAGETEYIALGGAYLQQSNYARALVCAEKGISLHPTSAHLWNILGLSLRGFSKLNEAGVAFEKAILCDPTFAKASYNLGRLHGEAVSFHRSQDIKKSMYGRTKNL